MEYINHRGNFLEEFLKINKVLKEDIEVSSFLNEKTQKPILDFKDKLISLRAEKFLLVGDYDCDGICSTVIIKKLLEYLKINHNFYIPSRTKDGYGLNENIVDVAIKNGFGVILTVDNGIVAHGALKKAKDNGIKTLIIDHHEYENEPDCFGFIHPNILDKDFNNLSAGGLSSLFASYFYDDSLSKVLGGLSTLSDMVGVLNYNRFLLKQMIDILRKEDIYQIKLLNGNDISYESLSFNVIPKINAISRMDNNPNALVKYFLSDKKVCLSSIKAINDVNDERKKETENELKIIAEQIDESKKIIIVKSQFVKEGLCGLIANRLLSKYQRPVLVFTVSEGILKGSGRSPESINIHEYLSGIKDIFDTFGGHGQACGLSLKEENYKKLLDYIDTHELKVEELCVDVIEMDIEDLDDRLLETIESLEPFGRDLKEPLIRLNSVSYFDKKLMANKYPKYNLTNNIAAISFNEDHNKLIFKDMIGYFKKDKYRKNAYSFVIEDLI
ncbi:MAG: DHHA1 domain-containing protein [Erysipelotrichaceae bacterium]|nr:DHHA1 domain-containing protein [Erysipelotrichaceae bacterium]